MICPECKSTNIRTERSPIGEIRCLDCDFVIKERGSKGNVLPITEQDYPIQPVKEPREEMEILLPMGFMNCGITGDGYMDADTNDSSNWQVIKFPLPKGKWRIHSYKNNNTTVVLIAV